MKTLRIQLKRADYHLNSISGKNQVSCSVMFLQKNNRTRMYGDFTRSTLMYLFMFFSAIIVFSILFLSAYSIYSQLSDANDIL